MELSDIEKSKLEQLNDDPVLFKALEKIFNEAIEKEMPIADLYSDNALLGEKWRGYDGAVRILEKGFKELEKFKKVKENQAEKVNPAR